MKSGKAALQDALRQKIILLDLKPDAELDEVELSKAYGISRTPVRDVLRQLASEGYVEIREQKSARVTSLNQDTLEDFFSTAPMVYEVVARRAVRNFKASQMDGLKDCQMRFRLAFDAGDAEAMVLENCSFHAIIGEMARSTFLKPSLNRLLIDHARIGHTFFRPRTKGMRASLAASCEQHEQFIEAIGERDEATVARLVHDHWDLCRGSMEPVAAPEVPMLRGPGRPSAAPSRKSRPEKAGAARARA